MAGAEVLNIVVLLGAVHGFILSALLFFSKKNNVQANRFLAGLILLIALACFNLYLQESDWYARFRGVQLLLEIIPLVLAMPFGPLLYFYIRSAADQHFKFKKKDALHFSPVIVDLVPNLIVWFALAGVLLKWITPQQTHGLGDWIDDYNAYADIPRWLSMTIYVLLSRRFLISHGMAHPGFVSHASYRWMTRLVNTLLCFQILWLCFLVPYIIPALRNDLLRAVGWYPLYVPMALLIYWIGIKGYLQSAELAPRKTNAFSAELIEKTVVLLHRAMEVDHVYRDPGLNLALLSTLIATPQKTISGVLNQHLNKSFSDFVNEYRIQEVKKQLTDPLTAHLTITGIAFECGFNSQATFQRVFKQMTNLSPSEFLAKNVSSTARSQRTARPH